MIWIEQRIETNFFEAMTAKNHPKLMCRETQERFDTELNLTDLKMSDALRRHINICAECTNVWTQNRHVKKALQRSVKRDTAPDSLRAKIQAMFDDKMRND
jgi:hypothetical protein